MKLLWNMQKAMDQNLAAMLTPEEYDIYQLTMSQTAGGIRMQLDGFDPSETEFREIFKLQKSLHDEFDDLRGMADLGSEEQERHRKRYTESEKLMEEDIRKLLGEARYEAAS